MFFLFVRVNAGIVKADDPAPFHHSPSYVTEHTNTHTSMHANTNTMQDTPDKCTHKPNKNNGPSGRIERVGVASPRHGQHEVYQDPSHEELLPTTAHRYRK